MKADGLHLLRDGSQMMYLKKRLTMRLEGILMQPISPTPLTVWGMTVSGQRRKGLLYGAAVEAFSADLVIESDMLDAEQSTGQWIAEICNLLGRPFLPTGRDPVSRHFQLASYLDGTQSMA